MLKKIIILFSLIFLSFPFFGFAGDNDGYCSGNSDGAGAGTKPLICYNSPEVVNKYLQDMVYVISLVNSAKSSSSGLGALGKKALDTGIGSLGVATMFASNGVGNFFQNFIIIFKGPHIVRDRVKITNFQQYITQKALKIASKGLLNENITNLIKIKNYIKGKDSFVISFNGITYKDLFKYLWKNQLYFEKTYYDRVIGKESIGTIYTNIVSNIKKDNLGFYVKFNSLNRLYQAFSDYDTDKCNTSWDDFKKNLKHVICTIGGDNLSKASKRFKCNYSRLLYVLNLGGAEGNCGSVKIAKWVPLSERLKAKVKVEGIGTLSYGNKNIKNGWNSDTASLNQMSKDIQKYAGLWNGIKEFGSDLSGMVHGNSLGKYSVIDISPADYAIKKQKDFIDSNLQAVIQDANDVGVNLAGVEAGKATHNITLLFPQISKQIDDIRKKIGKTVTEDGTIYKNIEKTCQNQSPQKGNCSYSK